MGDNNTNSRDTLQVCALRHPHTHTSRNLCCALSFLGRNPYAPLSTNTPGSFSPKYTLEVLPMLIYGCAELLRLGLGTPCPRRIVMNKASAKEEAQKAKKKERRNGGGTGDRERVKVSASFPEQSSFKSAIENSLLST